MLSVKVTKRIHRNKGDIKLVLSRSEADQESERGNYEITTSSKANGDAKSSRCFALRNRIRVIRDCGLWHLLFF